MILNQEQGWCSRLVAALAMVIGLCGQITPAEARDKMELGWLERVRLQPWDIVLKAKLDTGAKTAAIHATDIERFDKDGKQWVRFKLWLNHRDPGSETITVEKPLARARFASRRRGRAQAPAPLPRAPAEDSSRPPSRPLLALPPPPLAP